MKNCSNVRMLGMALVVAVLALTAGAVALDNGGGVVPKFTGDFKADYAAAKKALMSWNMHSLRYQVLEKSAAGFAFLEFNARDTGHKKEMDEMRKDTLATLARGGDFERGVALAKALYDDATAPCALRIEAANYLARGLAYGPKKDFAAADRMFAPFLGLPPEKFNVFDRKRVLKYRAWLYVNREDLAGARALIAGERAKITGNDGFKALVNRHYDEVEAEAIEAFYDNAEVLKFWMEKGNRAEALKLLAGGKVPDDALTLKLEKEALADGKASLDERTAAFGWLWSRDEKLCRDTLPALLAVDEKKASAKLCDILSSILTRADVCNVYGSATPAYFANWELVTRTWPLYVELCAKAGRVPGFKAAQYASMGFAGIRDLKGAIAAAETGLKAPKIKPEETYQLRLVAGILAIDAKDEDAVAAAVAALDRKLGDELCADMKTDVRKKHFERAGTEATVSCNETLARGVAKYYRATYYVTEAKKVYTVRFSDRDIGGAGDWANLPFKPEESDFDRQYGDKVMSFMLTDVATGDRGNAAEAGKAVRKHPTTLQVVADSWGIHIVQTFYDSRARQFESGELDAGSYESYIAPGENQPYTCFLCHPRKDDEAFVMNTTYESEGQRRTDPRNPLQLRNETVFTDDAVISYCAFPWTTFADHVPADGGEWDFESIFWGPVPSAWNGTKSIHGRGSWGKLRFELGEAGRVKILRAQLFKAVKNYKAEKTAKGTFAASAQEGIFDHWNDDAVGDVDFYNRDLKPLVEELDAVAARVKVGMPDEDVKEIAEKYLPKFRDIRSIVSRLRVRYLREQALK